MKHLQFLTVLLFIAITHSGFAQQQDRLIGEWIGTDNAWDRGGFIFEASHYAYIKVNKVLNGGENYNIKGVMCEMKYEVDSTKSPIWLDLVIYKKDTHKEIQRMKGILRFISNNKIEIRIGDDRFDHFRTKDEKDDGTAMTLTKVEK
jgi:hypothetical protein